MGLLFTPLQVLAFVTLAPSMRTEGAALFSLLRNLGAAIGVSVATSVLVRNAQAMHEMIGAAVNPFNRALQAAGPMHGWLDPATRHGAAMLDRIINEQAQIVAYADNYVLLIVATVPAWLLLLMMRLPRKVLNTPAASAAASRPCHASIRALRRVARRRTSWRLPVKWRHAPGAHRGAYLGKSNVRVTWAAHMLARSGRLAL
jgi:DHA2 family multidrug resistance protein